MRSAAPAQPTQQAPLAASPPRLGLQPDARQGLLPPRCTMALPVSRRRARFAVWLVASGAAFLLTRRGWL